ncbi:SRPBCC domain-containing protein [Microbacterium sp. W1N]|uniref:SRPBCC family protein n=1 Tax=Microbacterium festucae TaxID=2977531 RepID=UPI0021BE4C37|nr:SRPBCC domain-containing protein [Microbacterium festucae]MCT9820193.1 SRPBCC domain-containing protein [Microbacterium festucae]
MTGHPLRAIEIEVDLPAPPEVVWRSLTTPDGVAAWWWDHWDDVRIAVDARPGGAYRFAAPGAGIAVSGRYLTVDAPHRLAFTWVWEDDDGSTRDESCDLHLTEAPTGCRLSLRHTGPWPDETPGEDYREGWLFTLGRLQTILSALRRPGSL